MNHPSLPASPSSSQPALTRSRATRAFREGRLLQIALLIGSMLLMGCNRRYPDEPGCCRDDYNYDYRDYDYPYGPYPYNGAQSGSPADLPRGEREIGLVLDPGLRMWYDVYDAVPRRVYVGYGADGSSNLAHDLRVTNPWSLVYAGRSEPLYPSVSAWDHSGPTAHVRIRLDRSYRSNPLSIDLELRHGFVGNGHQVIEAYQVHGLLDGESLVLLVGGEISRGPWVQYWAAGGGGYLRGSVGHEELWMPGNGYHEARVEFR